jgi:hypothetical protein
MTDREETVFEDLDGSTNDTIPTAEVELEEVKEDDDIDVEIDSESGENEQPEEEEETEEEAPEGKGESPEAEEDKELESYSKKVRKRIERERRIARAAKAEAEALRQQLNQVTAEKEASANTQQIDQALAEKRAKLKATREEFDPEKVDEELKLLEEIADLQAQKRQLGARGTPPATKPQMPAPEAPKPNPHAVRWLERNQGWFDKPEYGAQSAVARQIDQALIAEGFSPDEEGYFEELDRRLAKTVRLPTRAKPKSPVAPVTEGTTPSKTKQKLRNRGGLQE